MDSELSWGIHLVLLCKDQPFIHSQGASNMAYQDGASIAEDGVPEVGNHNSQGDLLAVSKNAGAVRQSGVDDQVLRGGAC